MTEEINKIKSNIEEIQDRLEEISPDTTTRKNLDVYSGISLPVTPSDRDAILSVIKTSQPATLYISTGGSSFTPSVIDYELVIITTQNANITINNPIGESYEGKRLLIRIKDDSTPRTITFGSEYRSTGAVLPTTTVSGKWTYMGFFRNVYDTKWDLVAVATTV